MNPNAPRQDSWASPLDRPLTSADLSHDGAFGVDGSGPARETLHQPEVTALQQEAFDIGHKAVSTSIEVPPATLAAQAREAQTMQAIQAEEDMLQIYNPLTNPNNYTPRI